MRYRFGSSELDSGTMELHVDGSHVPLEPQVFRLLEYLIRHRQRAVSKDELHSEIWSDRVVTDATLSNCLKQARRAIGDDGSSQNQIRTVRGFGYRFVAEVSGSPPAEVAQALPVARSGEKPSLAFLGFNQLGDSDNDGYVLREGLANDLNARLARLHSLFVVARQSAKQFLLPEVAPSRAADLLGVRYLIQGAVQQNDRQLRITVNLTEAETARLVWSETYDRILDDVFVVQDEIVNAIIAALLPEIERAEMDRARMQPTENLDAWACYHRAMWHNFRFTAGDSEKAKAFLQRALHMDPDFARAHAALSFNHFLHAFLDTHADSGRDLELALEHGHASVNLDPRDGMSHWARGRALFLAEEHDQAMDSLDRALLANPNYAQGRYARGFVGMHAGLAEQALPDLDTARRLSPFDPMLFAMKSSRAVSLALQGDFGTASRWAVEATREPNAHFHIHAIAGACLALIGDLDGARKMAATAAAMHPGYSVAVFERSFPHQIPEHRQLFRDALLRAGLPEA